MVTIFPFLIGRFLFGRRPTSALPTKFSIPHLERPMPLCKHQYVLEKELRLCRRFPKRQQCLRPEYERRFRMNSGREPPTNLGVRTAPPVHKSLFYEERV